MATHKDDKKSDNVAKKKRPNARVLTKAERIKMEKNTVLHLVWLGKNTENKI